MRTLYNEIYIFRRTKRHNAIATILLCVQSKILLTHDNYKFRYSSTSSTVLLNASYQSPNLIINSSTLPRRHLWMRRFYTFTGALSTKPATTTSDNFKHQPAENWADSTHCSKFTRDRGRCDLKAISYKELKNWKGYSNVNNSNTVIMVVLDNYFVFK